MIVMFQMFNLLFIYIPWYIIAILQDSFLLQFVPPIAPAVAPIPEAHSKRLNSLLCPRTITLSHTCFSTNSDSTDSDTFGSSPNPLSDSRLADLFSELSCAIDLEPPVEC